MSHLSPETAAAYVDGTLSPARRGEADAHLGECGVCRTEIRDVRRVLKREDRSRWGRPAAIVSTLAAAAVTALLLLPDADRTGTPGTGTGLDGSPFRSAPLTDDAPVGIEPRPPRWSDESGTLTLLWRPVAGASTYRVTLTDAAGATLWSTETGDSVVSVSSDVELPTAQAYFWFVDATLADGGSASTGVQTLTAR